MYNLAVGSAARAALNAMSMNCSPRTCEKTDCRRPPELSSRHSLTTSFKEARFSSICSQRPRATLVAYPMIDLASVACHHGPNMGLDNRREVARAVDVFDPLRKLTMPDCVKQARIRHPRSRSKEPHRTKRMTANFLAVGLREVDQGVELSPAELATRCCPMMRRTNCWAKRNSRWIDSHLALFSGATIR
jgi:hypothetical protein